MTPSIDIKAARILVAGIGNIFLGDDAFGVEVVRLLAQRALPPNVQVTDFGIRGFDLTMALLADFDEVILVDASPRGGPPGTIYVIEPEPADSSEPAPGDPLLDPHTLDPVQVLRLVKAMGGKVRHVRVVGCEPEVLGPDQDWDIAAGLSEPVRRAVDPAVQLIESLIYQSSSPKGTLA
jgi:hydrogenase maturation protease